VDHIKDQRTGLINMTFILGTVLYVWYSQHGCRYHRHHYYINMWRHMTTENNAKNNKNVKTQCTGLHRLHNVRFAWTFPCHFSDCHAHYILCHQQYFVSKTAVLLTKYCWRLQIVERRSIWPANFPWPAPDLQLMGSLTVSCRSANLANSAFHPPGVDKWVVC